MLELFKLREATTSPVVGEMVKVPSELATEATPVLAHVPLIAKHPEVKFTPLAKVEEAELEVALKMLAWIPPAKVEVAVVVALSWPTVSKEEVAISVVPRLSLTITAPAG